MNAIILAAGMGTRLRPLTNEIPKCLVKVNGEAMVERQIKFLKEKGIEDITLVSGYKAEALDYLKGKYGVDIVFNEKYDVCNNIWSMVKVLDRFGDTYVLEGDVYMQSNCLRTDLTTSLYFAVNKTYENEWGLEVDDKMRLQKVNIGSGNGFIMSGLSYWTKDDGSIIINEIERLVDSEDYVNLFWDNAVINIHKKLNISIVATDSLNEIDTISELKELEEKIKDGK